MPECLKCPGTVTDNKTVRYILELEMILFENLNPVAAWGAILSTLLATIKLWEIWQNRTKIQIGYTFTSDPEIGNEIKIRNLSNTPIIITRWDLFWEHRHWFKKVIEDRTFPDYDFRDIRLNAHSSTSITYLGSDQFGWGGIPTGKRKLYLEITIAGKNKPLRKRVYG